MLKAIKDWVIVRQEYAKESGGVIIPDTARKFQQYDGSIRYIVIAVGPDYPYRLKKGDRVEIVRHEGRKFIYDGEEYYKMKAKWIVGVYE